MAGVAVMPRRKEESPPPLDPSLTSMRVYRRDVVFLRKLAPYLKVRTAGEAMSRLIDLHGRDLLQKFQDAERKH
jgi:hypothetical protein